MTKEPNLQLYRRKQSSKFKKATAILEKYYVFITPTPGLTDIEIEHIASPEGTLKESRE